MQVYTSANTSINRNHLPAIYKKVDVANAGQVLDYGCGKFFDAYGLPENVHGYDPYNRNVPEELERQYDTIICSNVLNVIMEHEVRKSLLETLKALGKQVYITVYEGDKTGVGRQTANDCYQLNRKIKDYLPEVIEVFGNAEIKNGMISTLTSL